MSRCSRDAGGGLLLSVQRYFSQAFGAARQVVAGGGFSASTVALDYRTDALVAWARDGAIYVRDLPAKSPAHPIQRLAAAGSQLRIAALLSDDNRAIVAWSERLGDATSVYIDQSSTGVRFGAPQLLERFAEPAAQPAPEGSPSLVRLSSESVMIAWAGSAAGHWVVRTAPIDLNGVGASTTIAAPGGDALLEDLAPGPDGEALALWTQPAPGTRRRQSSLADRAIFASRVIDAFPAGTIAGAPEQIAPAAEVGEAPVAIDPDSDGAVAVWRGQGGAIDYAVRGAPVPWQPPLLGARGAPRRVRARAALQRAHRAGGGL